MSEIHLRCIYPGHASVYYGDHEIGEVNRIEWPDQRDDGEIQYVVMEEVWEARSVGEGAIVSPYSFPAFKTRKEAAAYLADGY